MKSLILSFAVGSAALVAGFSSPAAAHASAVVRHSAASHVSAPSLAGSYNRANAYLKQGKYALAAASFQQAVKDRDHLAQSYGGLGLANLDLRKYRASFVAYQSAIRIAPNNPDYLYGAAVSAVSSRAQELETYGISYSQDYVALRRNDVKGYIIAFLAYSALLQAKGELSAARQIVRLRPHAADSYNYLGIAYANSRKLKLGINAFSRAIQLRSNVAQFWVNRGGVEVVMKQYQRGLSDYTHARAVAGNSAERAYVDALIKGVRHQMGKHK